MEKTNISESPIENQNNEDYLETVIKLIFQSLIDKFSLVKIISDVISITNIKESQLKLKDTIPLDSRDIISIMYKNVGSIKLYKCLLELSIERKKNEKSPEIKYYTPIKRKEIFLDCTSKKFPNYSPSISEENIKIKSNENSIKSTEKFPEELIDIFNSENEDRNINKIISLNEKEDESSDYEVMEPLSKSLNIFLDAKNKKKNKKLKKNKKGINLRAKHVNDEKKLEKDYLNKLGFHYTLEKGQFYKFKFINNKKETAKFICDDLNCNAFGEFMIYDKIFKLKKNHNISSSEHSYNKNMNIKEKNVLKFMKENNIEDLQLTTE